MTKNDIEACHRLDDSRKTQSYSQLVAILLYVF